MRSLARGLRLLRILVDPVLVPLVRFVAITSIPFALFWIVVGVAVDGEPVRDHNRVLYLITTLQLAELTKTVERYRADCGNYPSAEAGLAALIASKGVKGWKGPI